MKIILAKDAGFCMGVRKAVLRIVREIDSNRGPLWIYGPLIHNPQTIEVFASRGVNTIPDLASIDGRRIVIRTHGIPAETMRDIRGRAAQVINLTCPRVARVQSIIKKYSAQGCYTVIVGDKDHAEVVGLKSFAAGGVAVISEPEEVSIIPQADRCLVVSQTTFDRDKFETIVARIREKLRNVIVFDTICEATADRQKSVVSGINEGIDTLVVVGGKNSANTRRLADIGRTRGIRTFHVETDKELAERDFIGTRTVLVTAGTSTPGWILNNVLERLYTIRYRNARPFIRSALSLLVLSVRTAVFAAGEAFFITLISLRTAGLQSDTLLAAISSLAIFAMHTANNYFERDRLRLSNPYKYEIYRKHGSTLIGAAIVSSIISIGAAWLRSGILAAFISAATLLGFLYSSPITRRIVARLDVLLIRRLYSSKLVVAFGWVLICSIVPLLMHGADILAVVASAVFTFSFVFLRTVLLDLIGYQGDLLMGRDTLVLWLGTKTIVVASAVVAAGAGIALIGMTLITGNPHWLFCVGPIVYFLALTFIIGRHTHLIAVKYELLADAVILILAVCLVCVRCF